jgi:hypothetical protein
MGGWVGCFFTHLHLYTYTLSLLCSTVSQLFVFFAKKLNHKALKEHKGLICFSFVIANFSPLLCLRLPHEIEVHTERQLFHGVNNLSEGFEITSRR